MKNKSFILYTLGVLGFILFSFPTTVIGDGSCASTPNTPTNREQIGFRLQMNNLNMFDCNDTDQINFLNSVAVLQYDQGQDRFDQDNCNNFKSGRPATKAYHNFKIKPVTFYTLSAHDFTFNGIQYMASCTQTGLIPISIPGTSYQYMETCTCTWTPQFPSDNASITMPKVLPLPEDENGAYYFTKDGDVEKVYAWFFTKEKCLRFLTAEECVWPKVH